MAKGNKNSDDDELVLNNWSHRELTNGRFGVYAPDGRLTTIHNHEHMAARRVAEKNK